MCVLLTTEVSVLKSHANWYTVSFLAERVFGPAATVSSCNAMSNPRAGLESANLQLSISARFTEIVLLVAELASAKARDFFRPIF